jgi:ribonuclease VapC
MIVDTSALAALVFQERAAEQIHDALIDSPGSRMSAATYVELGVVTDSRLGAQDRHRVDRLLATYEITIEPVTVEQAFVARVAYRDFGRGSGHPAKLNFGDTFSYALASVANEPLLFVGDAFTHTDIVPALPAAIGG